MKTLRFHRDERKNRVTVECADGMVEVHSHCGYCIHCTAVRVGKRVMPTPQRQARDGVTEGASPDEVMLTAAMMFNTLVRDGEAIECDDDANEGFRSLYHY